MKAGGGLGILQFEVERMRCREHIHPARPGARSKRFKYKSSPSLGCINGTPKPNTESKTSQPHGAASSYLQQAGVWR